MKFLRRYIFFFISSLSVQPAWCQFAFYNEKYVEGKFTFELTGEVGAMNCLTDLGGNRGTGKRFIKDLNIGQTRATYGFSATISYKRSVAFRTQIATGTVMANDRVLKNAGAEARGRYLRNLDFFSRVTEASGLVELSPLMIIAREGSWLPSTEWYVFAGLGYFHFNPKTFYGEKSLELWSLRTEGQGFDEYPDRLPYKRYQLSIPFGSGLKFGILPNMNLRLELNCRKLFTDYLDDVSTGYIDPTLFVKYMPPTRADMASALSDRRQSNLSQGDQPTEIRGNNKNNDSFFAFSVRVSLVFGRQRTH